MARAVLIPDSRDSAKISSEHFPITTSARPQTYLSHPFPRVLLSLAFMDASALLTKQGWRGTGHGLGSTGHGIARPLLISNKQDALGVGKKKLQVADQWWMRAYDAGLKELGTGKQVRIPSLL